MSRRLPSKFQPGAVVYHQPADRGPGFVREVCFTADGGHYYAIGWETSNSSTHYEPELSTVRNFSTPDVGGSDIETK